MDIPGNVAANIIKGHTNHCVITAVNSHFLIVNIHFGSKSLCRLRDFRKFRFTYSFAVILPVQKRAVCKYTLPFQTFNSHFIISVIRRFAFLSYRKHKLILVFDINSRKSAVYILGNNISVLIGDDMPYLIGIAIAVTFE